jgi:hypothetical protein
MTRAQVSYFKLLSEEANDPSAFDENLIKTEAFVPRKASIERSRESVR